MSHREQRCLRQRSCYYHGHRPCHRGAPEDVRRVAQRTVLRVQQRPSHGHRVLCAAWSQAGRHVNTWFGSEKEARSRWAPGLAIASVAGAASSATLRGCAKTKIEMTSEPRKFARVQPPLRRQPFVGPVGLGLLTWFFCTHLIRPSSSHLPSFAVVLRSIISPSSLADAAATFLRTS